MQQPPIPPPVLNDLGLEVHLLRTLPPTKIPRNLKMRLKTVAEAWELPNPDVYPPGYRIAQRIIGLDEKPPEDIQKLCFLTRNFEGSLGSKPKTPTLHELGERLGFEWTATWPTTGTLGKRTATEATEQLGREHKLTVSMFGVKREVPMNRDLNAYLETLAAQHLSALGEKLADQEFHEFRVRYDDITHLSDIQLFLGSSETPVATCTHYDAAESYQSFDDPELAVFFHVSQILFKDYKEVEDGILSLLNTTLYSIEAWMLIYEESTVVPQHRDLEQLIQPFLTLQVWSEAIYRLFFRPVVECFYPAVLTGEAQNTKGSDPDTNPDVWILGLKVFNKIQGLEEIITQTRTTRNLSLLKGFWKDPKIIKLSDSSFYSKDIRQIISDALKGRNMFDRLFSCLEPEFSKFKDAHEGKVLMELSIPKIEIPLETRKELLPKLMNLVLQFTKPKRANEMVTAMKLDWLSVKTLSGQHKIENNYTQSFFDRSLQTSAAVAYKDITILFLENSQNLYTEVQACIIDKWSNCNLYSFPSFETFVCCKDKLRFTWTNGLCVWFGMITEQTLGASCLDFRGCADGFSQSPLFHTTFLGEDVFSTQGIAGQWATVGFDTIWLMSYRTSVLPMLFVSLISVDGITLPERLDWTSHFQPDELEKLNRFTAQGTHDYRSNIIAADTSRTMFLSFLERANLEAGNNAPLKVRDLWILCFRMNRSGDCISFFTKKKFNVKPLEMYPADITDINVLVTRIIHIRRHDFLLMSLGNGPIRAFVVIRMRLIQVKVNGTPCAIYPNLPGERLQLHGFHTNYLTVCSYTHSQDRFLNDGKNILLNFQMVCFNY